MSSPSRLLLFLLTVLLVPAFRCAPLPGRRDDGLIMGTDFLSLFIREQQRGSTTSSSYVEDTTTEEQTTSTTEVALAVTQPNVQVSVRVSSSVSGTTTSPDIFTTFLNAFSETAPSPSAAIRSSLTVEEPAYGTRLSRRRQQFSSDSQSASEQIVVRFSPKTTPIPTPAKKLEPPKELTKNSELPEQLYEKLQTEKAYVDEGDNYAEELKLSRAYAEPENLFENQQVIADQLYGQHNNEVPESAPATQGLQVFDKTLEAERVAAIQKVGYVVEGRNYRKYRVEERTPDGFIVGEYGVVSHDDGQLRGVRYTADSTINPKLIYEALMNFLKLK
ncbi:hypothetical protein B566_EDAN006422 [Ephemera danica]|nr:hypothetical protein B566_EDAN006422 [Ephemera danica]